MEAKYRLRDARHGVAIRDALARLGAKPKSDYDEANDLYDQGTRLRRGGAVLRVRTRSDMPGAILTYKGPASFAGAIRSRVEWETAVGSEPVVREILGALGFAIGLRYEKHRAEWTLGDVTIAIDTLPFGAFCEIEGPEHEIEPLAQDLGLRPSMASRLGYPALTARWLRRQGAVRDRAARSADRPRTRRSTAGDAGRASPADGR